MIAIKFNIKASMKKSIYEGGQIASLNLKMMFQILTDDS